MLADLDRRPVEADVRDVVLPAAIGAAAHLDVDPAGQLVVELHLLEALRDRLIEPHRAGDSELARVGARAADDIGDLVGARFAELELGQAVQTSYTRLVADPAKDQVLVHRRTGIAAAVLAHDLTEAAELLRRQVTARDLDLDGAEAALALGLRRWSPRSGRTRAGRRSRTRSPRARPARPTPRRGRTGSASSEKSRSATQSPSSSSSTSSRNASIPILSISTLIRARARLTRRNSWRSKIRMHASVTFR